MSGKLSTFAVALLGLLASSLLAGGQNGSSQDAAPQKDSLVITSGETSPPVADKQADKELIEIQKTCPVTDQPLGSMGAPMKVVVKKQTVFLCCAACKKKLSANPDKYLKKLDKQNEKR